MGSVTQFRRRWPGLIRKVQSERHTKFQKKPTLKLGRGKPRNETWWRNGEVTRSKITLPKRIIRNYKEKYAVIMARHELRESLAIQGGWRASRAHAYASRRQRGDMRRLSHRRKSYPSPFAVSPQIIRFAIRPPILGRSLSLSQSTFFRL